MQSQLHCNYTVRTNKVKKGERCIQNDEPPDNDANKPSCRPQLSIQQVFQLGKTIPRKYCKCCAICWQDKILQLVSTSFHLLQNRKTSFCLREGRETSRWLTLGQAVMSSKEVKKNIFISFIREFQRNSQVP